MSRQKLSGIDTSRYRGLINSHDLETVNVIEPDMDSGPWIAGGACLKWYQDQDVQLSDIDVWFKNQEQFDQVKQTLLLGNFRVEHDTPNATTFRGGPNGTRVQLIRKQWFESPQEVLDSFDFTVCQIVTDGYTYLMGPRTKSDIKRKILHATRSNKAAIQRAFKYIAYGYIPDESVTYFIENTEGLVSDFTNDNPYTH